MSIKILLWCLNIYQVNDISRIKVGVVGLGYGRDYHLVHLQKNTKHLDLIFLIKGLVN